MHIPFLVGITEVGKSRQLCLTKFNLSINGIVGEIHLVRWVAAFAFRIDTVDFIEYIERVI